MLDPVWLSDTNDFLKKLNKSLDQEIVISWSLEMDEFHKIEEGIKSVDTSECDYPPILHELENIKEAHVIKLITQLEEWADSFNWLIDEYKNIINDAHK